MGQWFSTEVSEPQKYVAIYGCKNNGEWTLAAETNNDRLAMFTNSPKNVEEWLEIEMKYKDESSWPGWKFCSEISDEPINHDVIITKLSK
jgi:hypothetical protein